MPRPGANDRLLIGEVFSKIVPAEPGNGQPLSGAVAYTRTRLFVVSSIRIGRVWQSPTVPKVARLQVPSAARPSTTTCGEEAPILSRLVLMTAKTRPDGSAWTCLMFR